MSFLLVNRLTCLTERLSYAILTRTYAKPLGGGVSKKAGKKTKSDPAMQKVIIPAESDPHKLVNYVCGSNIYTTGEDVKLKPESEYPDWLWDIHVGPPKPISELDPNTKEYWRRVRAAALNRNNRLRKLRKF